MIHVNDIIQYTTSDGQMTVVGQVFHVDRDGTIRFKERWAASVWGESTGEAGKEWSVPKENVKLYARHHRNIQLENQRENSAEKFGGTPVEVTEEMIENGKAVWEIGCNLTTGVNEKWVRLGDLPYNDAGQTPNEVFSFTVALAALLNTGGGPFIVKLTDEAAHYIMGHELKSYFDCVEAACRRANVEFPSGCLPVAPDPDEMIVLNMEYDDGDLPEVLGEFVRMDEDAVVYRGSLSGEITWAPEDCVKITTRAKAAVLIAEVDAAL